MIATYRFLCGMCDFYRSLLTRYVEPDDMPVREWTDGT